jgi:hypothetical protein
MATIKQIQTGFARFVDSHIAGAFEGWQRAVVVGGSTLLAANLPNVVKTHGASPLIGALGVYNPEAGTVDVDALYNAFIPNMGNDKIPISIPKIGTIRLGRDDIDVLMRCIKEA